MVSNFGFLRSPKVLFGAGQAASVSVMIENRGTRFLILTGMKSHTQNRYTEKLISDLGRKYHAEFEAVDHEPSPSDIDKISDKYRNSDIHAVIAIGGGSVLDAGKAVSAMLPVKGRVRDYLEGVGTLTHSGQKKYFAALPTTAGTGSEATSNAVLSETGRNGFKRSLRHENFVPDVAVIDPLLTIECPSEITASSGMDAFTQLLESYLSVKANALTDALAIEGIKNIHRCLERAVKDGTDIEARSGMSYAAFLSGLTLANAGLGLIHGFASSVGGMVNIPHGLVCGTMMGVVNRYNVNSLLMQSEITMAHIKYTRVGKIFSEKPDQTDNWYMKFATDYIDRLTEKFLLKRLGSFGLKDQDLVKIANNTDHKANPVKFESQQLVEMLKSRL